MQNGTQVQSKNQEDTILLVEIAGIDTFDFGYWRYMQTQSILDYRISCLIDICSLERSKDADEQSENGFENANMIYCYI